VKSLIPTVARFRIIAAGLVAAAITLGVTTAAHAQEVVVFVNGEPITALDIQQRAKFILLTTKKPAPLKEVLDSLIDEILEVKEAKRFTIDVPDDAVNKDYAAVASRMGLDAQKLSDILARDGTSADTLKRRLRAQMAWMALVRGRYKASLEIPDSDVEAQLQLHKSDKPDIGYEYILRPVVFIVPRGAPDSAFEARKKDAEALRQRFSNCNDGIPFARALDAVAVRDQVSKFSADLPTALRQILDGTAVGHLTPPEQTTEGVQMFAICDKRETKSDTPEMHAIRDQIFQQKFGAKAKRYLDELRREAMIEYKIPDFKLGELK
jgi:peptidyl-prolyl cis-trans isomerase SurA